MTHPYVSKRKANNLSGGLFLIGLATLSYLEIWWPGILLVIGLPFAVRQALLGKGYDAILIACIFAGLFVSYLFPNKGIFIPVVLFCAGIYLIFRDVSEPEEEDEEEEELQKELEEK